MSEFIANIKARLNTSEIPKDIQKIESQQITLKNVTIDAKAISSAIQKELSSAKFSLNISNVTSQMRQQGAESGRQFTKALTSELNTIKIKPEGLDGLKTAFSKLGYDEKSISAITKGLQELNLVTGQIRIKNRNNGFFDLSIKGVDGLGRSVSEIVRFGQDVDGAMTRVTTTVQKFGSTVSQMKSMEKINLGIETGNFDFKLNDIIQKSQSLSSVSQVTKDNISKLNESFQIMTNGSADTDSRIKAYERFSQLLPIIEGQLGKVATAEKTANVEFKQTLQAASQQADQKQKAAQEAAATITKSSTLISNIQTWINENTVAAERFGAEIVKITSQLQGNSDPALFNNLKRDFENIKAQAKELELDTVSLKRVLSDINGGTTGVSKLSKDISDVETKFRSLRETINNLKSVNPQLYATQELSDVAKGLDRVRQLERELGSGTLTPAEMSKKYVELRDTLSSVDRQISIVKTDVNGLSQAERDQAKAAEEVAKANQTLTRSETLSNKIEAWMNANTEAAKRYGTQLQAIQQQLKNNQDPEVLKRMTLEFSKIQSEAKAAGLVVNNFASSLKNTALQVLGLTSAVAIFHRGISVLKEMVQNVKDVDKAMTELYRVTNLSSSQYEALYDKMTVSAKQYGATLSDVINSTASWVRLGFDANTAAQLSEISAMYQHVTDLDEATAVKNLVTAYKGFQESLLNQTGGNEVEAFSQIADVYDRLGNEFAESAADVGDGLSRSASVLQQGGASIQEAAGKNLPERIEICVKNTF